MKIENVMWKGAPRNINPTILLLLLTYPILLSHKYTESLNNRAGNYPTTAIHRNTDVEWTNWWSGK